MAYFRYRARNQEGRVVLGTVEATDQMRANEALVSHGLSPISLELTAARMGFAEIIFRFSRVSPKDLVIFFRQLATLINAQIRVPMALRILTRQVSSQKFRTIIDAVATEVEGGASLSDSLGQHPDLFPELYTSLVRAGEASGKLDNSLSYLADQVEKDYDLRTKIRGAMTYPIFIVVLLFIVGALMMVFVIPSMTSVLEEANVELPLTTKIIIGSSHAVRTYWYLFLGGLLALGIAGRYYLSKREGRYFIDQTLLKLPGIGDFLRKIYIYRFSHHLSNLLSGGISINKALTLISDVIGNLVYRDIFLQASQDIQTGRSLHEVLESYEEIPPLVSQMVAVGDETGDLAGILSKLSNFYDKEVQAGIAKLTTLIEPVIMVVLGLAVGIMVAGILLPMYNLASAF